MFAWLFLIKFRWGVGIVMSGDLTTIAICHFVMIVLPTYNIRYFYHA